MKHKINLLCIAFMMLVLGARADEGMWLPYSINGQNLADMQRLGCKLTAEQIFSFNQPSLKDAIVQFGGLVSATILNLLVMPATYKIFARFISAADK